MATRLFFVGKLRGAWTRVFNLHHVIFWPDYNLKITYDKLVTIKDQSVRQNTHPYGSKGLSRRLGNKTKLKALERRCISRKQLTIRRTIQGRGMGALEQADLRLGLLTWYCVSAVGPGLVRGRPAHSGRLLGPVTFIVQGFTLVRLVMHKYLMTKIIRRTQTGMTYCQRNSS